MNANSMLPTPAIKDPHYDGGLPLLRDWLNDASHQLTKIGISSSALDAEIILADALQKDRTYLHAHPEQIINHNQVKIANHNLESRLKRMPIAYIIGHKEFYGHKFKVSPDTLIPRPESETIIELLADILENNPRDQPVKLVDVGTGSGCLGITAKLEFPNINVTLLDISNQALVIAMQNAKNLSANVEIIQGNLLRDYPIKIDILIANLPYVDRLWDRSPETNYEPSLALFADNHGLDIIEKLILQTNDNLVIGGYLILEADPEQHHILIKFAKKHFLELLKQEGYIIVFKKLT